MKASDCRRWPTMWNFRRISSIRSNAKPRSSTGAGASSWRARAGARDRIDPTMASGRDGEDTPTALDFLASESSTAQLIRKKVVEILSGAVRDAELNFGSRRGALKRYRLRIAALGKGTSGFAIVVNEDVTETYQLQREKRLLTDQLMRSEETGAAPDRARNARFDRPGPGRDRAQSQAAAASGGRPGRAGRVRRSPLDPHAHAAGCPDVELSAPSAVARGRRTGAGAGVADQGSFEPDAHRHRVRKQLSRTRACRSSWKWRSTASRRKP